MGTLIFKWSQLKYKWDGMEKESSLRKTPSMVTELLKKAVAEKSQSAVARETGLTLLTVQQYLKGIGEPRQKNLERLAKYFGKSVAELRGEEKVFGPGDPFNVELSDLIRPFINKYLQVNPGLADSGMTVEFKFEEGDVVGLKINGKDVDNDDFFK